MADENNAAVTEPVVPNKLHVSVGPHVRNSLTTGKAMFDVILALLPATVAGVYVHGIHALMVVLTSVITAVFAEYMFCYITGKPNTVTDWSAAVTGLLLALCLPASVPLYIPFLGSLFAIIIVKCLFGGLGKNFMNPALTARCFLLVSFGTIMTRYTIDGVTSATPLTSLLRGDASQIVNSFWGYSSDVIGSSVGALLLGGLFLWVIGGITWEIPTATVVSFTIFVGLFGPHGFDPVFLLGHLFGGGVIMGAFFMANDPVTCPANTSGQLVYGALVGVLSGIFRVYGSATDSVSYAILIANLTTPFLDEYVIPTPYAYRQGAQEGRVEGQKKFSFPKPALALLIITAIAGVALSGVYKITKDPIAQQQLAANMASYKEVCPGANNFTPGDGIGADAIAEEVYGADYGKVKINEVILGDDGSSIVSVTSSDAYDGTLTVVVGIGKDGTVQGISFTELHDSPGMGMLCGEDAFKSQFKNVKASSFILNKNGGSTAPGEIDSVSGASRTSGAVVNAVNAALDFWNAYVKEGV